jgi:hypothetical protein
MKSVMLISTLILCISCGNQEIHKINNKKKSQSTSNKKRTSQILNCKLPYNIKDDRFVLYYYPTQQYQQDIEKQGGEDYWLTILDDNTYELDSIYLYIISKKIKCEVSRIENFPYCINSKQDVLMRGDLNDSLFGFLLFEKNKKPIQLNLNNFNKYIK